MYAIVKNVVMPAMASVLRLAVATVVITTEGTEKNKSTKRGVRVLTQIPRTLSDFLL
jgi:hypothetical protein